MTYNATSGQGYTYDQENRITGLSGYGYTYDSDGNRVIKTTTATPATGTLYWYMTPGIVAESGLAGSIKSEYVFFDGERVARRDTNSGVFYYFSDRLKTAAVETDASGNIKDESDFYPWGGELQFTSSNDNHYKFTGKERDAESGLDYFGARYMSNSMGRFMTPDWSANLDPIPYADLETPQTLNLYSYVQNNPLARRDVTGHRSCDPDTWDSKTYTLTAGACHFDWSDMPQLAVAMGHHFIPKQVWQNISKATNAWRVLNKTTTGALKNYKISNSFNRLHRALNRQTDRVLRDVERDLGKSLEDFERGDFEKLGQRLEAAGEDIQAFNERLAALEPEAKTFAQALEAALEEVFPAAVDAAMATGEAAGAAAEVAAESGIIPE